MCEWGGIDETAPSPVSLHPFQLGLRASRSCVRELHSRPRLWQLQGVESHGFYGEIGPEVCPMLQEGSVVYKHSDRISVSMHSKGKKCFCPVQEVFHDASRVLCMWGLPEGQRELSWSGLVPTPKLRISRTCWMPTPWFVERACRKVILMGVGSKWLNDFPSP